MSDRNTTVDRLGEPTGKAPQHNFANWLNMNFFATYSFWNRRCELCSLVPFGDIHLEHHFGSNHPIHSFKAEAMRAITLSTRAQRGDGRGTKTCTDLVLQKGSQLLVGVEPLIINA